MVKACGLLLFKLNLINQPAEKREERKVCQEQYGRLHEGDLLLHKLKSLS